MLAVLFLLYCLPFSCKVAFWQLFTIKKRILMNQPSPTLNLFRFISFELWIVFPLGCVSIIIIIIIIIILSIRCDFVFVSQNAVVCNWKYVDCFMHFLSCVVSLCTFQSYKTCVTDILNSGLYKPRIGRTGQCKNHAPAILADHCESIACQWVVYWAEHTGRWSM